jgi:hypothetical protein
LWELQAASYKLQAVREEARTGYRFGPFLELQVSSGKLQAVRVTGIISAITSKRGEVSLKPQRLFAFAFGL